MRSVPRGSRPSSTHSSGASNSFAAGGIICGRRVCATGGRSTLEAAEIRRIWKLILASFVPAYDRSSCVGSPSTESLAYSRHQPSVAIGTRTAHYPLSTTRVLACISRRRWAQSTAWCCGRRFGSERVEVCALRKEDACDLRRLRSIPQGSR